MATPTGQREVIPNQRGGGGVDALPPAGDARRDVLRQRDDQLAEQAEGLSGEGGAIDPRALEVENEIGAAFNEMDPPHKRADMRYKWVYRAPFTRSATGMQSFTQAKAEGWQPVRENDPDGKDMDHCETTPEGFIVVGDVILMRLPIERYVRIRRAAKDQTMRRETAINADLAAIARSAGSRMYDTAELEQVNQRWSETMEARAKTAMAGQMANKQMDKWIRDGRVPGVPAPRGR